MRNPSLDYEDDWVYVRHDADAQGAIPDAWSVYRTNGCAGWSLIAAMWGTREQAIARGHNLDRRDSRELAAEALDALDRSISETNSSAAARVSNRANWQNFRPEEQS